MKSKLIAAICAIALILATPDPALSESCGGDEEMVFCAEQGEEDMSLLTKILIGVLVYAIIATLLYRQGGSDDEFSPSS